MKDSTSLEKAVSLRNQCADSWKSNQLGKAYGVVYRARDRNSNIVALKQIRILPQERQNGIPITAIREIAILQSLRHINIINILDVAVGQGSENCSDDGSERRSEGRGLDEVYMVMEYAEQVADFGMAREYSPRPLTPGVVTIWYRSPELLLGTSHYNPSVDLWSAGLILTELLLCTPLLPGDTEIQQLALIVKLLGTPSPDSIAALSAIGCPDLSRWRREQLPQGRVDNLERRFLSETTKETVRFIGGLLKWDPDERWTAAEALAKGRNKNAGEAERWWRESPREVDKDLLPTFPEIRNGERIGGEMVHRGTDKISTRKGKGNDGARSAKGASLESYVFDFGTDQMESQSQRVTKRHRIR
ncbi:hypothetical protein FGG08_003263 [Glutinoglossum americanum]|uniref:cyclin-dependent kinase n=1 Tax=Glutinoglossum americanum TaxID=1670608 RepID=A0A9P8KYB0_9PEZI|nr:hypothetical protein FGG08_003263 [Glutinoglossum americanum]